MASRRTLPIPIPGVELEHMKETLAPLYGAQLWEEAGHRILVVRTPGEEPDVVNDLERAVERLSPGDVHDLDHCLLVGGLRSTAVSVQPLVELMEQRVRRDKEIAQLLRQHIPGRDGHLLWRDPSAGRRAVRLALRIPKPRARDIDDDDLEVLADRIGPELHTAPMRAVTAVHLLADEDDVRIDPDIMLQDLRARWEDDDRRLRAEAEERRREETEKDERRREREAIVSLLKSRYTHHDDAPRAFLDTAVPRRDRSGIDAVLERAGPTAGGTGDRTTAPRPPAPTPVLERVQARLRASGYDVLDHPDVPGHVVDLAAERDGDPGRVIARVAPRLTLSLAEDVLETCRALGTDLALIVAETADDEARERLVATKATWVVPDDLDQLRL